MTSGLTSTWYPATSKIFLKSFELIELSSTTNIDRPRPYDAVDAYHVSYITSHMTSSPRLPISSSSSLVFASPHWKRIVSRRCETSLWFPPPICSGWWSIAVSHDFEIWNFTFPPIRSTISLVMVRPSPEPPYFSEISELACENRLKRFFASSSVRPMPVSLTYDIIVRHHTMTCRVKWIGRWLTSKLRTIFSSGVFIQFSLMSYSCRILSSSLWHLQWTMTPPLRVNLIEFEMRLINIWHASVQGIDEDRDLRQSLWIADDRKVLMEYFGCIAAPAETLLHDPRVEHQFHLLSSVTRHYSSSWRHHLSENRGGTEGYLSQIDLVCVWVDLRGIQHRVHNFFQMITGDRYRVGQLM